MQPMPTHENIFNQIINHRENKFVNRIIFININKVIRIWFACYNKKNKTKNSKPTYTSKPVFACPHLRYLWFCEYLKTNDYSHFAYQMLISSVLLMNVETAQLVQYKSKSMYHHISMWRQCNDPITKSKLYLHWSHRKSWVYNHYTASIRTLLP